MKVRVKITPTWRKMLKNEQKKGCQGSFSIFSYSKLVILEEYKFFIMDFFSKCDQIRRKLRIGHIYCRNP